MEKAIDPTSKNYLDLPGEDRIKSINKNDRKISLKESTQVFEHYIKPGEKPDMNDILTNPKFGNHKRTNVIYEHSTGSPEDTITEKPVVNHVTEEWVDDRKYESKAKPKDVNYRLALSNSDLESLPSMYQKDFTTPDADIHLIVDKTALEEDNKKNERKLYLDRKPLRNNRLPVKQNLDDSDWGRAFQSFGSDNQNIFDKDLSNFDPRGNSIRKLAPSSFSTSIDNFSGNPRENLDDMMGGISENDMLNSFISKDKKGFKDDLEDKNALREFENEMNANTGSLKLPILI